VRRGCAVSAQAVPAAGGTLRLDARLGACLRVRLQVQDGRSVEGTLGLYGANFERGMELEARERPAAGATSFEFRGLDPDSMWTVAPKLESHASFAASGLELDAGSEREVELELTTGATISGQVVDEGGRPMADLEVRIADTQEWMGGADERRGQAEGAEPDYHESAAERPLAPETEHERHGG